MRHLKTQPGERTATPMKNSARPLTIAACAVAALLLLVPATAGAQSPTRERYVEYLEPICKKDAERTARILEGVRSRVLRFRMGIASLQFERATRAFNQTLRRLVRVPRPAEDRETLARWLEAMKRQSRLMAKTSVVMKKRYRVQAVMLDSRLVSNADRANAIVMHMGFDHCLLDPEQFG